MKIIGLRLGSVLKCHAGSGKPGMVEVTKVYDPPSSQVDYVHLDGSGRGTLYVAHMYQDAECIRTDRERRIATAAKVGTNVNRRKK